MSDPKLVQLKTLERQMKWPLNFAANDDGLTTIEWVVICAVVLIAALSISGYVLTGASTLGGAVGDKMSAAAEEVE